MGALDHIKEYAVLYSIKVGLLLVWPIVFLSCLAATDENGAGQAALIFFALLPYVTWCIVWMFGAFFEIFTLDEVITVTEMIIGSIFSGIILPACILVPVYHSAKLKDDGKGVVLAYIITLPSLWIPCIISIFQTPIIVDAQSQVSQASRPASSSSNYQDELGHQYRIKSEMKWSFLSYLLCFSIPLGIFVTTFDYSQSISVDIEAVVMSIIMIIHTSSLLWLLAPRWSLVFFQLFGGGTQQVQQSYLLWTKFIVCAIIAPVLAYLPALRASQLRNFPHDVLLAFIILLPTATILDILRIHFIDNKRQLIMSWLVFLLCFAIPLGVLLPIWIASDLSETGQVIFLVFILSPVVILMIWILALTIKTYHNLPFEPLLICMQAGTAIEILFAIFAVSIPLIILAPVAFASQLDSKASFAAIGFMALLSSLIMTCFIVSFCSRAPSQTPQGRRTKPGRRKVNHDVIIEPGVNETFMHRGPASQAFDPNFGENHQSQDENIQIPGQIEREDDEMSEEPDMSLFETTAPIQKESRPSTASLEPQLHKLASRPTSVRNRQNNIPPTIGNERKESRQSLSLASTSMITSTLTEFKVVEMMPASKVDEDGFESAKAWELNPTMKSLTCFAADMEVAVGAEVGRGDYYATYYVEIQGETAKHVLKWPLYNTMQTKDACLVALDKIHLASTVVNAFNDALKQAYPEANHEIELMSPFAVCLTNRRSSWALCEPSLLVSMSAESNDTATVWNDATGRIANISSTDQQIFDMMQACSCFSYFFSDKRFLMCNLQGIGSRISNPDFHFTDDDEDPFYSPNNHGEAGVKAFFDTFQQSDMSIRILRMLPNFDNSWITGHEYLDIAS